MNEEGAHGGGPGGDDAHVRGSDINAHDRELMTNDAHVRGSRESRMNDAHVRGSSESMMNDAHVRGSSISEAAHVRGRRDENARVREQRVDDAYGREQLERGRARDRGHGIFASGDNQCSRRKRRIQSEESDNESRGRTKPKRRRSYRRQRSKRKRRYYYSSSTESSSSGESEEVHSRSKRARSSRDNDDSILNKVLTIIKDVRSSDKSKMTYNNVIPDFDPMKKEQTILTWLTKVEECAEIYGWDEKETIHYSLPKLCGVAKSWYQGLPTLLHTWSEWKKKLIESFPCREDYAELLTEMLGKRVKYGESLEEYFYAKVNLLNRCKIKGRQAVDCLLHGVDDRAVRVGAQAAQFPEPEQVLKYFRSVKVGNSRENDYLRRNSNRFDRNATTSTNKPNYPKAGPSSSNIRCYNCNQVGHPSFKCDKPAVKCTSCDRLGHQSTHCFKNRQNNNLTSHNDKTEKQVSELSVMDRAQVSELSVMNNANDKYIINIRVNGIPFDCHLDLGSQCTLIRESDSKLLNMTMVTDVELPMLRGIGANLVRPLGMLVVTVEVQNIKEFIDIYVVEDYVLQYPVLLGHSFTEKPHLIITKTPDKIIFQKVSHNDKVHLISRDQVTVPVNTLRAVPVQCASLEKGIVFVDGSIRGQEGQQYYLLPGEYGITNNGCALLIQNVSDSDITIKKDVLMTRATQIYMMSNVSEVTVSVIEPCDTINCNPNLSEEHRAALKDVLTEYRDCFSSSLKDLGYTNATKMTIDLEDSQPVVYRPYRMSHSERSLVRDMVDDMLSSGIVRESSSPYASPIVLVKKKTGEKRLCVDYRALNRKTKKDHYPLPRIEDQLDLLAGNKLFTSLDLASGYYQIPIDEDSRLKTAFVTPDGQYEYNRMPFGLVNAPSVFQRTINKILAEAKIKYALVYMDDILIPSKDIDEGLLRLKEVLDLLRKGGLTLKMSKCNFFYENIDFLGFEVSASGIRPGSKKSEAVSKFPSPRNQHELRQFLGLSGFFRRFIKDYALIAAPLSELLKKDREWIWRDVEEKSFSRIKNLLVERPVLSLYNPSAETHLHTDASKKGLAGILLQRNHNGDLQPVSYFSRKTTSEEQKYHSFELETLAIIASLNRFRVYLIGIPFTIQTDCNAIRTTLTKRDLVPRIARWWIQLQEYDCTIEYRSGARMSHVDALSRNPVNEYSEESHVLDILVVESDQDWITTVQSTDDDIIRIKNILSDPNTEHVTDVYKNYKLKNGRVYRIVGEEIKWVVPKGVRWQILKRNHDDVGHFGYEKTLERIKKHYWFGRMRRFVKKYVSACLECAHHKAPGGRREGELHPIEKISVPFHTIHADHLGPFVRSKVGNCYLLVIIDSFTKFINITPVKNTKSVTSIKVLKDHISFFGVPTRLITDRGSSFTSKTFKEFTSDFGIKHILNAVATPRANGQVERFNRTILEALATSNHGRDEKQWDEHIRDIQMGINTAVHKTTQKSPSELLFGFNITHRAQGILSTVIHDTINVLSPDELDTVREEANKRVEIQQQKDVERFNRNRKQGRSYKVGDLVRIERQVPHDGQSQKLVVKYQGPYRILKLLPNDRFIVEDTPLTRKNSRRYEGTVALDKIQPWMNFDRNFNDSEDSCDDKDNDADDNEIVNQANIANKSNDFGAVNEDVTEPNENYPSS